MPSAAGLFGEQAVRLFAILVVIYHLRAVAPLSLSAGEHQSPPKDADNTTNTPRIENFQEVTTVDESIQNVVAFSFDYFTHNISIAENAIFQLRWETADNSSSGLIRLTVTKSSGFNQTNHTTEGAATYRFTVNAAALGEGSLHLTVLRSLRLQCLRYRHTYGRFYSCSQSSRYCTCEQWKYETKAESETIQISAKKGDFDVINFKDVTAESDLDENKAVFEFEFDPMIRLSTYLGYTLHLIWSQVSGSRSVVIEGGDCRYYRQRNAQLERVGHTGTYRLYVPIRLLGDGRLLVNLTINMSCIGSRNVECGCSDWQVRGTSNSLEISAKREFENTSASIENFKEVTTVDESAQNLVVFSFDLFTSDLNISTDDRVINNGIFQLRWETADNSSTGLIQYLTITKSRRFKQTNHTTEGAATYHFTVNARAFGEGPLLLTLSTKLQCFYYSSSHCNLNPQPRCTCTQWQYEAESETIQISAKKGDFDIINFRDVSTDSALNNSTAIFEFQFDPVARLNTFDYDLRLTWSQVSGQSSGVIEAAVGRYYRKRDAQLEQVGHTGTYRLYVPLRLLGDGHLLVNLTINMLCTRNYYISSWTRYSRGQYGCSDWQVRGTSESLEISAKRGPVNIVNLRDITTQSDLKNQSAVFSFDTHPKISPIVALGYRVQIQWSQLGIEFRSSRGFGSHTVYVPPGSTRNCRGTPKTTLELVGTGSYKLTVPTAVFDSGPLSIRVSVSLACLERQSSCSTCYPWRYTSQASSSIDISAKKGSLAPFEVDLKLWPKEQCFEAVNAIKASDISTLLIKSIRDNTADMADTSHLQVYGERYLCERNGYLSFRGVLVKLYDFLATKNRDTLGEWLKGGARHIVVAERQMNIKEGACGIALTSLEDPACDKSAGRRG